MDLIRQDSENFKKLFEKDADRTNIISIYFYIFYNPETELSRIMTSYNIENINMNLLGYSLFGAIMMSETSLKSKQVDIRYLLNMGLKLTQKDIEFATLLIYDLMKDNIVLFLLCEIPLSSDTRSYIMKLLYKNIVRKHEIFNVLSEQML